MLGGYLVNGSARSGIRIGESLQLTLEDLELNEDPAKVSGTRGLRTCR